MKPMRSLIHFWTDAGSKTSNWPTENYRWGPVLTSLEQSLGDPRGLNRTQLNLTSLK